MRGAFTGIDLLFFLGYMVIVLWIGFAVGRREKATINDYFRAGNRLPWFAVGFSIIAAGINSVNLVAENGLAYSFGFPILNWEWMIPPALSILLWIFIPIYLRNRITTMPEYLERRYGPRSRTLYACLIVSSYVFAVFTTVFYSAGFTMEALWGIDRYWAIAIVATMTGAYTIYGGLASVAWTDLFQCLLLLGSGVFVFVSGMQHIGWDFLKVLGEGQRAHLHTPATHPVVPWTALIILALSTNTWWYATDQCINQRCLGAKNEWHAKMGVLLAGAIQIFLPLATCSAGLIYFVMQPNLKVADEAYIHMVRAVIPPGLRGIVAAALLGAIMSAVSGLVNSTSTMVTLDIVQRWKGRNWSEAKLVRTGQWAGGIALALGALMAPIVMNWKSMFMYSQEIWAPMAAPAVVAFVGGALWKPGKERGAVACMWLAILTVPLTFALKFINDASAGMAQACWSCWASPILPAVVAVILIGSALFARIGKGTLFAAVLGIPTLFVTVALYAGSALQHADMKLPMSLRAAMVWAGGIYLFAIALLIILSLDDNPWRSRFKCLLAAIPIAYVTTLHDGIVVALLVLASFIFAVVYSCTRARQPVANMWDRSMLGLPAGEKQAWYANLWVWWLIVTTVFVAIYIYFW